MEKRIIEEDEFLEQLNQRLKQHDMYEPGMEFVPYPADSSGKNISGYSTTGPFHLTLVYSQVAHSVDEDFILKVTR
jgi:hypothetical protein